ncbi:transcriptional regulator ATRX homolog isoform X2 [Nilaparvata lugens]|uniref:transcriptional regulator ATRX homolog isoform X2 n=1 Tax=Nilaparvata lugens TaxID=108931 RepID=UPI00193E299D|nr:transcriptional regulator ATRX homolog isoform X2 [Nilaparvata lugens]
MSKLLDGKLPVVRLRRLEDGSPKKNARSKSTKQEPSRSLAKKKASLLEAARQLCTDNIQDSIKLADDIRLKSTKIKDERIIDARLDELENVDKLERNLQRYYDTLIEGVHTLKSALAEELADWRTHFQRKLGGTLAPKSATCRNVASDNADNSKTGGRRGVKPTSDEENMSVDEASSKKMDEDNDSDKENMSKDKVNGTKSDSDEGITSRDKVDSDRQSSDEQVTSKEKVKGRKKVSSDRGTPSKDNTSERDEKQSSDEENTNKKRVKGRKRVSSDRGTPSKDNTSERDEKQSSDEENTSKKRVKGRKRESSDRGTPSKDNTSERDEKQSSDEENTSKKRVKGRKRVSSDRGTPSKDNTSERDEKQSSDEENLKKRVKGKKRVSSDRGSPNTSDSSDEGAPSKDKVKDGGKGSRSSENISSDVDKEDQSHLAMECVGESDSSSSSGEKKESESDDNDKGKSKSSQKQAKAKNEKCSKMKLKKSNEKSTLKKRKSDDSNSEDSDSDDGKSEKVKNDNDENVESDDEVDTSLKKELDVRAKMLLESSSDDLLDEDDADEDDDDDDVQVAKKSSSKEKKLTKKRGSPRKVGQDEDDKPKVAKRKKCKEEEEDDEKESKEIARLTNLKSLEATRQKNSTDSNSGSSSEDDRPKAKKPKTPAVKKRKVANSEASKENSSDSKDINSDDDDSNDLMDYIIPKIIKQEDIHHKVLQCLFESSASESSEEAEEEEDLGKKKKGKKAKNEKKKRIKEEEESSDSDASRSSANVFQIKQKSWRKDKLLTGKLTDTDTSEDERRESKWRKKQQQKAAESSDSSDVDFVPKKDKAKAKKPRIVLSDSDIIEISESDEDSSSSSVEITKKGKKRKRGSRSSADGSSSSDDDTKKKAKKKRKRIINNSSSDNDEGDEGDELNESNASQGKSGRKNIKKIMKDKDVAEATRSAAKEEEERRQRIMERQKMYNAIYEAVEDTASKKVDKLVLDFDPETKKPIISVDKGLVAKMKPHQAKGVKFMWDACFESVERIKTSKGGGCILAHCMGLGKTFQVVSLVHTLLTHKKLTRVKRVLIVCPFSTILNWYAEFDKWTKEVEKNDDLNVSHVINEKENYRRAYRLKDWHEEGGVMIMGYDMFRNLTNQNKKLKAKLRDAFQMSLVDPGPDLVVCDEGHLLKNEMTALSKAMTRIKTLRRVVLTGTPLQNNLVEYHCMVSFIKPNLLGSKKEFTNRFVNPINNGQFADSTERDFRVMKRRAHVLHKMLDGLVQRRDYNVLTPYLPPKQEYVLSIRLTDLQVKLYERFLYNKGTITKGQKVRLLADFQLLSRVWTHPLALKYNLERQLKKAENEERSDDSAGSLKDFVVDSSSEDETSTSQSDNEAESTKPSAKRVTRANKNSDDDVVEVEDDPEKMAVATRDAWWSDLVESHHFDEIATSSKLILLFDFLKKCDEIGDKVLVFSQSLYSLDLIEHFLSEMDDATQRGDEGGEGADPLLGHRGRWLRGRDYFRLDGSTKGENRSAWIKSFNRESNTRARLFLISTRAGGLGINLTSANRVIIFDASWNPSQDIQSIFRVYRFGQRKPCYIYRFVAQGTMEEKVYERQISKLSLSQRVVDEQQVNRYFSQHDLQELYNFKPAREEDAPIPIVPKDRLMADILQEHKKWIFKIFEHDSLLDHVEEEELDEEERKAAWEDYENEKKRGFGGPQPSHQIPAAALNFNIVRSSLPPDTYGNMMKMIDVKYPHKSAAEKHSMAVTTMTQVYIKCHNDKLREQYQQQYQREALQRQMEHNEYIQRVQQQMRMGTAAAAAAAPSRPWSGPAPSSSANT